MIDYAMLPDMEAGAFKSSVDRDPCTSFTMLVIALELFLVFVFTFILVLYFYYQNCFNYWKKRGVAQLEPSFPSGDLGLAAWGKESIYIRLQTIYNKFKDAGHRFGGIYFTNGPIFFPVDPEIVKRVLVIDFDHFVDRGMYINRDKAPLSAHIFSMKGEEWRNVRIKFSPTFTSGKMKSMYNIILKISRTLLKILEPLAEKHETVDMKDLLLRFTSDIIGSAAFGVDVNSLEHPDTEFAIMVAKIFNSPGWKLLKMWFEEGLQNPGNLIKIAADNKIVHKYFYDLVKKTVEYRDQNNVVRADFLNMLMQMRSSGMTLDEMVSQTFLMYTAGFETSSSTMSNCVHELAHNQKLQDKLRNEIHTRLGRDSANYNYEDILNLPYLDKCVKETLRKYPPVPMLNRICVKDYQIPATDITIKKDTPVLISVLGLHRDPEYYPDPLEFDPERFSEDNKIVPYTYLPFGEGPRNCIGMRFGLMQTKYGLATLLNHFKFLPSPKSPRHLEVDPSSTTIVFNIIGGVYTQVVPV